MATRRIYWFKLGDAWVKATTRYKEEHVNSWIGSEDVKRKIEKFDDLVLGISSYWRKNDVVAHTLCISLGKSVLICDLEALGSIPMVLKNLLRNNKIYGRKTFA